MDDAGENRAHDPVQDELEAWTIGTSMSEGLRARLISETDEDRLDDHMRAGRSDSLLHLAWLRS